MSLLRLPLLIAATLLGACTSLPDRPPLPELDEAARFAAVQPATGRRSDDTVGWWRTAVPADTWTLLETHLERNPALRRAADEQAAAAARLRQAEAETGPRAAVDATARTQKTDAASSNSRSLGADVTLPIDLNGAQAQRRSAARYRLQASADDAAQLRSDLARDYLLALLDGGEARERLTLLERQLEIADTLLRLIELRFTQGLASSVDVLQQRDQRAALRQQLPIARRDAATADNRLRRIAGATPGNDVPGNGEALIDVAGTFAAVQPIELLQRRASLRAQRARIAAADAAFAAALADRWPTLSASGSLLRRVVSGDYSSLLSATLDAAFTLFDGGNKRAIAAERRAELAAAGERYLGDWIDSVLDADDLMLEAGSLRERLVLSEERLASSAVLLNAAQRRYERGISDYLPVLEALRGLQQQERDHLALRAALARTRIRLHHAFGHLPAEGPS